MGTLNGARGAARPPVGGRLASGLRGVGFPVQQLRCVDGTWRGAGGAAGAHGGSRTRGCAAPFRSIGQGGPTRGCGSCGTPKRPAFGGALARIEIPFKGEYVVLACGDKRPMGDAFVLAAFRG